MSGVDKSFFEAGNTQAINTRERLAGMVLDEAYNWLSATGDDVRRLDLPARCGAWMHRC